MLRAARFALVATALVASGCSKSKPDCKGTAVVCGDTCVELKSDNLNCGACGAVCDAGKVCSNGTCAVTCASGLLNCGGTCIDPTTDRAHCGAADTCTGADAGAACDAGELCSAGACVQTCAAAQVACPDVSPTYCADNTRDANNCGSCGTVCPSGQQCSNATCACPATTPDACTTGAGIAFCTNSNTDPLNCGTCGNVCPSGTACSSGACVTSCPSGEYACSGKCIDPLSDPAFCGAMSDCTGGTVCGATQACSAGTCRELIAPCTWQEVFFSDLTSLPAGATTANGGMGGQTVENVYGRTAWYQTSDWNTLAFPHGLSSTDDVFALEADFYLPPYSSFRRGAGVYVFNTLGLDCGTYGVNAGVVTTSAEDALASWWRYPDACATGTRTTPVSFVAGQWHTMRLEGRRSTCVFNLKIDGVSVDALTGTCDLRGGTFSLNSGGTTLVPMNVAWSHLRVLKGSDACVPQ